MSGEETDEETIAGREKQLVRAPILWICSEVTDLFHTMDTWKSAVNDESFMAPRGNRPLRRLLKSKAPVEGTATKRLPQNWYNETWYRSLSDPKKALLNPTSNRPIPSLVSLIYFVCSLICSMDSPATPLMINYHASSDLVTW
jgi:hypothetical protein